MKTYNLLYFAALSFVVFFSSCEKEIKFNGKQSKSKVVMNGDVYNGNIRLAISSSKFLFREIEDSSSSSTWQPEDRKNSEEIDNAIVTMTINDQQIDLNKNHTGLYLYAGDKFKAGDKFFVSAEVDELGTVIAEDVYPHAPEILSVDTLRFFDEDEYTLYMRTMIKIMDRTGEKNYYRLLHNRNPIYVINGEEHQGGHDNDFIINQDIAMSSLTNEGILGEDENLFRIFPDDLFDGKEYTINIYFPLARGSHMLKDKILVQFELQSLTESYYMYMRTLEQSNNSDIFTQPVRVYSNVKNGYGILGLYDSTSYEFYVMPDQEIYDDNLEDNKKQAIT